VLVNSWQLPLHDSDNWRRLGKQLDLFVSFAFKPTNTMALSMTASGSLGLGGYSSSEDEDTDDVQPPQVLRLLPSPGR